MNIIKGQFTGLITKPRYLGYGGHYKLFEGMRCKLPDGKEGLIRYNHNKGAWCFQLIGSGVKILLYKLLNVIEPSDVKEI